MKNNNKHIDEDFLLAILTGNATKEQVNAFEKWKQSSMENRELFRKMEKLWNSSEEIEIFQKIDTEADWKIVQQKTGKTIRMKRTYQLMRYAATILLLLSFGMMYLFQTTPGFGKYVQTKTTTTKEQVVLADGSKVFLNKKSRIIYPKHFNSDKRNIKLEGEAYFQVKPNPTKPFIVTSGNAVIKVLGTSFNVHNKLDGSIIVSVNSGKVSLMNQNTKEIIYLEKGEKGVIQKGSLAESKNNELNYDSWKTEVLIFKDTPIKKVFSDLEKFYDLKIINKSSRLDSLKYNNTFIDASINQVIDELELVLKIQITQKGNQLILTDKK